jgi:hypothetical protein
LPPGLPRDHIGDRQAARRHADGQLFGAAIGMVGWNLRDWPELTEQTSPTGALNDQVPAQRRHHGDGHASGYTVTIMSQIFTKDGSTCASRPTSTSRGRTRWPRSSSVARPTS